MTNPIKSCAEKFVERFKPTIESVKCPHELKGLSLDELYGAMANVIDQIEQEAFERGRRLLPQSSCPHFCCKYQTIDPDNFCDYCLRQTGHVICNQRTK